LKPAMKLDLINYSALARVIRPYVEEKIGAPVELETMVMAIRRNAHLLTKTPSPLVFDVIKDMKVELTTGMSFVTLKRKHGVYEQLMDLVKSVNAEQMENIWVTQRTDEISVIIPDQLLQKLSKLPAIRKDKSIIAEIRNELALINIKVPSTHLEIPGIYGVLTTRLGDMGISLYSIMASFTKLSFLCREEDAPMAYDRINRLIHESKELSRLGRESKNHSLI